SDRRTDQLLPGGVAGFHDYDVYPLKGPALKVAGRLARGHTRGGKAILYAWTSPPVLKVAEVIRYQLSKIGLDVKIKSFPRPLHVAKTGTRGEPFDLSLGFWIADYPDPADMFVLVDGRTIQAIGNENISYFDEPAVNRRIAAANRLFGEKRDRAFSL